MDAITNRRHELLDEIVDAFLASGTAELSLRPLAEKVGTSARLLIYHFETKEKLVTAALQQVRLRVEESLKARSAREKPASLREFLFMFWDWATQKSNQNYFRLLFEVDGIAMFNDKFSKGARRDGDTIWIAMIERASAALPEGGGVFSAHATLIRATMSGLLQDFLSTGDLKRTTSVLSAFIDLIDGTDTAPRRRSGKKS
jgi:AcrR family transcriptional regulator